MDRSDADTDAGGESADDGPTGVVAGADGDGDSDPAMEGDDAVERPDAGAEAGDGDEGRDVGESGGTGAEDTPEPTPQSEALRRQQRYVGAGGALVAGGALAVVTFQQFTDSLGIAVLVGIAGTALVLWLVRKSIFPGDATVAE